MNKGKREGCCQHRGENYYANVLSALNYELIRNNSKILEK